MIEVLINYGGRPTGGLRIEPGIYADDDPALFGLADYLIRNGHAIHVVEERDPEPTASPDAVQEQDAPKRGKRK